MGKFDPQLAKKFRDIQTILLKEWDIVGVNGTQAQDEYNAFIPVISELLQDNVTEDQVFEELKIIALEDFGMPESKELDQLTRQAAQKLILLKG